MSSTGITILLTLQLIWMCAERFWEILDFIENDNKTI